MYVVCVNEANVRSIQSISRALLDHESSAKGGRIEEVPNVVGVWGVLPGLPVRKAFWRI